MLDTEKRYRYIKPDGIAPVGSEFYFVGDNLVSKHSVKLPNPGPKGPWVERPVVKTPDIVESDWEEIPETSFVLDIWGVKLRVTRDDEFQKTFYVELDGEFTEWVHISAEQAIQLRDFLTRMLQ